MTSLTIRLSEWGDQKSPEIRSEVHLKVWGHSRKAFWTGKCTHALFAQDALIASFMEDVLSRSGSMPREAVSVFIVTNREHDGP